MRVLKSFILLSVFSTAFGVEEAEVTPELPVPAPFLVEDLDRRMTEETSQSETSITLRSGGIWDYALLFLNRSPFRQFDLSGKLQLLRNEDFTSTEKRLLVLEIAVPIKHFWTAAGARYHFRKSDGAFSEEKSSISSFLELGLNCSSWNLESRGHASSAWLENGRNDSWKAGTDISRHYRNGVFHVNMEWTRETAPDSALNVASLEIKNTLRLSNKMVVGGGVYCGGSDVLHVYPQVSILVTPVKPLLFKAEFDPGVELIGGKTYLEKEFSVPGDPSDELHSFRWSAELVWSLNQLNRIRGGMLIERVDPAVIWEWDFAENHLSPLSRESYQRRNAEVRIEGGNQRVSWSIYTQVSRCTDEEGYQIPDYPVSNSDVQIRFSFHPFVLSGEAHYCGKRFASRREESPLDSFIILSSSLTLNFKNFSFLIGSDNLTDNEYELYPSIYHRGRKYKLELGLTAPR